MSLSSEAARYKGELHAAAARHRANPTLLAGVIAAESYFDPRAYNPEGDGTNPSRGLAQMTQRTATALGFSGPWEQLYDPATSLDLGARLLAENFAIASRAAPLAGRRELENRAVSAYNAGFSRIRPGDAKRTTGGQFINRVYVDRVRRFQGVLAPTIGSGAVELPPLVATGAPEPPGWILPTALAAVVLLVLFNTYQTRGDGFLRQ